MYLSLTAIHEGENKDFFCQLDQLETAFDVLSGIAAQGHVLITARIMDNHRWMELPLDIFDGSPFSNHIAALQQDWEAILAYPRPVTTPAHQERLALSQKSLAQGEASIRSFEYLLNRLADLHSRADSCGMPSITAHFAHLIAQYEQWLTRAQRSRQDALRRLSQLGT